MFVSKWILTIFACALPLNIVHRIWDRFICDGWESVLRIGLAVLKRSEKNLLATSIDDVFVYFDNLPKDVLDPNELFQCSYEIKIDKELSRKIKECKN